MCVQVKPFTSLVAFCTLASYANSEPPKSSWEQYVPDTPVRHWITSPFILIPCIAKIIDHQALYLYLCRSLLILSLHIIHITYNIISFCDESTTQFSVVLPSPSLPSRWIGIGSNTGSHIPELFAPCHTQALLLGPTPVLVTPLAQGVLSTPCIHWVPNQHVCRCLNHSVDKTQVLCFWTTCKSEERTGV